MDPLTKEYPWYTPYQFAGNKPIWSIDRDGLEEYIYTWGLNSNSEVELVKLNEDQTKPKNSIHQIEVGDKVLGTTSWTQSFEALNIIKQKGWSDGEATAAALFFDIGEWQDVTFRPITEEELIDAAQAEEIRKYGNLIAAMIVTDGLVRNFPNKAPKVRKPKSSKVVVPNKTTTVKTSEISFQLETKGGNTFSRATSQGREYTFNRSHSFDRAHKRPGSTETTSFEGTGLTAEKIERSIINDLNGKTLPKLGEGQPYKNTININGHNVEYNAGTVNDGVRVSNYFIK